MDVKPSKLRLTKQKLIGDRPPFQRESFFFDEANDQIVVYWSEVEDIEVAEDETEGAEDEDTEEVKAEDTEMTDAEETRYIPPVFHISYLNMKTGRWTKKTNRFKKVRAPGSPFSKRLQDPLPPLHGAAATFCRIEDQSVILLFGGLDADGNISNNFYIINLTTFEWWQEKVPSSVEPRHEAWITFVDNRLYIFGGRERESFSVLELDEDTLQWKWVVQDQAYPASIPMLGYVGGALPVFNGSQILLFPGLLSDDNEDVDFHRPLVLFDVVMHEFTTLTLRGLPPSLVIVAYDMFVVSHNRFFGATIPTKKQSEVEPCCSLLLVTWDTWGGPGTEGYRLVPELIVLDLLKGQDTIQARYLQPGLRSRLRKRDVSTWFSCGLRGQQIILVGSDATVDEETHLNVCIKIDL
ncbi:hypothetical protein DXG01_006405 [Tephrocybe rancida]|nr:hypothetical protein DXG01_006405 [Tephrocybe rancida]